MNSSARTPLSWSSVSCLPSGENIAPAPCCPYSVRKSRHRLTPRISVTTPHWPDACFRAAKASTTPRPPSPLARRLLQGGEGVGHLPLALERLQPPVAAEQIGLLGDLGVVVEDER